MKKDRIYIALSEFCRNDDRPRRLLMESGFEMCENLSGRRLLREEIIEALRGASGVVAGVEPYDAEILGSLPDLRCISRCGVGLDNVDLTYARERNIGVLNTPTVVVQPAAELTVAMILDLLKKLTRHTALLRSGRWEKMTGGLLAGRKVGVLGLGRIGKRVAEMLSNLDARVYGSDVAPDPEWAKRHVVTLLPVRELLETVDVLTLHLSPLPENPFRLGEREIRLMRPGALLVNVSRGQTVDEEALYQALKEGHLDGAALDVFPEEPYTGKLRDLDNIILTPHIATLTKESRSQMELEAVANLVRFLSESSHL
jgi:D-3-phosphoglycerate dehydrogenase / 2-oxoglutarate reductase